MMPVGSTLETVMTQTAFALPSSIGGGKPKLRANRLLVGATLLVAICAKHDAFAQNPEKRAFANVESSESGSEADADVFIRDGIKACKKKDYVTAEEKLRKAWHLIGSPAVASMLADVEMKLKHYRAAAEHWSAYLRSLSSQQEAERTETLVQLKTCREHVGSVKLIVDPPTAVVSIDFDAVALAPTDGEFWLEPGEYQFLARVGDAASPMQSVTVSAGDERVLKLVVPPPKRKVVTTVPIQWMDVNNGEVGRDTSSWLTTKNIVVGSEGIATLVALGISVGYTVAYNNAESDAKALREQLERENTTPAVAPCSVTNPPTTCVSLSDRLGDRNHAGRIANVTWPTTAVLAGITIGTFLLWPSGNPKTSTSYRVTVAPWWTDTTKGAGMHMAF